MSEKKSVDMRFIDRANTVPCILRDECKLKTRLSLSLNMNENFECIKLIEKMD